MADAANNTEAGEESPAFAPLNPVQCIAFLDDKGRKKNIKRAFKLGLPRVGTLPLSTDPVLSIVGGGPTLNETFREIKGKTMVIGSAHDHACKLGIKPTFAIECDPSLSQVSHYKENPEGTTYLVASRCDPSMFKHLRNRRVFMWHMWEESLGKQIFQSEPAYICGATVFLSAIPVALSLGFREFRFYGIDSSIVSETHHHAYSIEEQAKIIRVRVGSDTGREFLTTATWAGQAQQYQDMVKHWGHLFKAKFVGDGMLAEMERIAGRQ